MSRKNPKKQSLRRLQDPLCYYWSSNHSRDDTLRNCLLHKNRNINMPYGFNRQRNFQHTYTLLKLHEHIIRLAQPNTIWSSNLGASCTNLWRSTVRHSETCQRPNQGGHTTSGSSHHRLCMRRALWSPLYSSKTSRNHAARWEQQRRRW
jgi:hypothetical protein